MPKSCAADRGILDVMSEVDDLRELDSVAAEIRAHDGVAILGAGVSAPSRMPLSPQLDSLVWHSLEGDQDALAEIHRELQLPSLTAKQTVERVGSDRDQLWDAISAHPQVRERFQNGFAALDRERQNEYSPGHTAIAEMLHRGHLEMVISLNWDTQLEAAWTARYGQVRSIARRLVKPHGDAARPDEPWVLPGQQRSLPPELIRRLEELVAERPRLVLIAGYSEADELVVQQLIAPLERRWKVVRIGRAATGTLALQASADIALPKLRDAIDARPEAPTWRYLHFDPQHDLSWALSGRGLGTQDVTVCPQLPEVQMALTELEATGSATIIGESGSGKSLAAAQAAHVLWQRGSEVVGLSDPETPPSELRQTLLALPRPVAAIVDDAQRMDRDTRRELLAAAGHGLSVISVVNGAVSGERGTRIDSERGTRLLADYIRANRDEVLPTVRALDPHIGDRPLDEPLERRLAQAEKVAITPWHLVYVLTGGWRRIRGDLADLRAHGSYDLALGLVAIVQRLRRGDSAREADLEELAAAAGNDQAWLREAIRQASERRLLIEEGSLIRLPHLRFTRVVFDLILASVNRERLVAASQEAIGGGRYELSGIHWLLDEFFFADPHASPKRSQLTPDLARRLVTRCWEAGPEERGAAALVINDIRRIRPEAVDLPTKAALLGSWISNASPAEMSGLARLVNDTYNGDEELLRPICDEVDAVSLARAFENSNWPEPYFFGELLGRLALGPESFRVEMAAALDRDAVARLFRAWPEAEESELFDLAEAVSGLASFDYELALDVCEELAPAIAARWSERFTAGYNDLLDILFVLGFGPKFLRAHQPAHRERRIMRTICETLDPEGVADQVSRAPEREWQGVGEGLTLIGEASPRHVKRILARVDFDFLDASTAEFWSDRTESLRYLLVSFAHGPDNEPAANWVARHMPEMRTIGTLAAALAPEACARRLEELDQVLAVGNPSHHWSVTALALHGVATVSPEIARSSVEHQRAAFTAAFADAHHFDEAEGLIKLLKDLDETELRSAIAAVDPSQARVNWTRVLRKEGAGARRVVARLISAALETEGAMRDLARELRNRFPVATADPDSLRLEGGPPQKPQDR